MKYDFEGCAATNFHNAQRVFSDLIVVLTLPLYRVKYFISEPLDGSGCVELFLFDRRITALAGQRTKKNTK